jgi:hypothetical protein
LSNSYAIELGVAEQADGADEAGASDVTDFEDDLEEVPEPVFDRAQVVGIPLTEVEPASHPTRGCGAWCR